MLWPRLRGKRGLLMKNQLNDQHLKRDRVLEELGKMCKLTEKCI